MSAVAGDVGVHWKLARGHRQPSHNFPTPVELSTASVFHVGFGHRGTSPESIREGGGLGYALVYKYEVTNLAVFGRLSRKRVNHLFAGHGYDVLGAEDPDQVQSLLASLDGSGSPAPARTSPDLQAQRRQRQD
ncbi:hypothetical protein [Parafrankia sp. FMc2]|uniref:hypothetical protein n=1 Tax=Parafrankia sp. FMc2 TaxID=3233196 RepID=UPI0034D3B5F8